jgi:hypothetical protein
MISSGYRKLFSFFGTFSAALALASFVAMRGEKAKLPLLGELDINGNNVTLFSIPSLALSLTIAALAILWFADPTEPRLRRMPVAFVDSADIDYATFQARIYLGSLLLALLLFPAVVLAYSYYHLLETTVSCGDPAMPFGSFGRHFSLAALSAPGYWHSHFTIDGKSYYPVLEPLLYGAFCVGALAAVVGATRRVVRPVTRSTPKLSG